MVTSLEDEKVTSNLPESQETHQKDEKVTSNLPIDWRKIRPALNIQQVSFIANSEPKEIVQEFAKSKINISPRTASNWRIYAVNELEQKQQGYQQ